MSELFYNLTIDKVIQPVMEMELRPMALHLHPKGVTRGAGVEFYTAHLYTQNKRAKSQDQRFYKRNVLGGRKYNQS